jgi:inner membrane protein
MATIIFHGVAAASIITVFPIQKSWKIYLLGIVGSMLPDIDVIGFYNNIPYGNLLGHRGITHSILFAFVYGAVIGLIFHKMYYRATILLALCTLTHTLLDAMTNGGLGVALFAPFENSRHFFSFRPIAVSPLGIHNFLNSNGLSVLKNEFIWIGLPSLALILAHFLINLRNNKSV